MKLDKLTYIIKVAECGSISKAAKDLHLSQPTLTKAISSIEDKYNVRIFTRTPSGVTLTAAGKNFINCSKQIIYNLDLLNEMFTLDSDSKSELSISFQQLDFMSDLILKSYNMNDNNSIEFDFKTYNRGDVFESVQKRESNIGLLVLSPDDSRGLEWNLSSTNLDSEILATSPLYACIGDKSPLYNKQTVSLKDLSRYPTVCLDIDDLTKAEWLLHKKNVYKFGNNIIYTNSVELCKELLKSTDMVLYTHKWTTNFFTDDKIKIKKPFDSLDDNYQLVYIKRTNEVLPKLETEFIDNLKNSLKSEE